MYRFGLPYFNRYVKPLNPSGPTPVRREMGGEIDIERWLRRRVLGLLHAGRVAPGDRLPSIRQVTQQTGADHRAVAEAYRVLETEGLVSIRPGSGVYAALPERTGGVHSETVRWLTELMLDGWERGFSRGEVGELVRRSTTARLRCACLESNEDHMVAICAELEEDFAVTPVPVLVDAFTTARDVAAEGLEGTDLVVSTIFHADLARAVAGRAGKPVVVIRFHSDFSAEVERLLTQRAITVVFVDPRYEERARAFMGVTAHRDRIRFVQVDEGEDGSYDPESGDVILTRAARRWLGMADFHLIPPPPPVISTESARELFDLVNRLAFRDPGEAVER